VVASSPELNMSRYARLSQATLGSLSAPVAKPLYKRDAIAAGQVHLGVGAFMRAHVALYNDEVMNASGGDWGIAGVSLRQAAVKEQLAPQDGLYTVAVCDGVTEQYRLIGSIKSVDVAPANPQKIVRMIADPSIRIVSLTVTEKGYSISPESGALDTASAAISRDLRDLANPVSTLGFLAAGLRLRRDSGAAPLTIMSCDNLPHNGARLQRALSEFIDLAVPDLQAWIADNVRFPATMVDRIVPATTPDALDRAAETIGLYDAALVRTEPFTQWVIENDFAASRPEWERAGALLVEDVEPYELAKLRLLNGPHSALAYLGFLGGYEYIHDVLQNDKYVKFVRYMMEQEISPSTPQPDGMQHAAYIDQLLGRFSNTSLKHRTWQIAMDGSQKLPQRLLNTVRAQLARGGPIAGLTLAVAAWIRYTQGSDEHGSVIDVRDPLVERFANIRAESAGDPDDIVSRYLEIAEVFGSDLPLQARFVSTVAGQLRELLHKGAAKTVAEFADNCGRV
jgi:fructuronate reductase